MTQPDKLFSKEELESILPNNDIRGYDRIPYPLSHVLVRQLLDSMREVEMLCRLNKYNAGMMEKNFSTFKRELERLRSAIHNLEPLRDSDWHGKWRIIRCLDALNQNKDSVPCATCGKPMEDRGAETQWCAECSGKRSETKIGTPPYGSNRCPNCSRGINAYTQAVTLAELCGCSTKTSDTDA